MQRLDIDREYSQSPQDIGSYFAGLSAEVQDGTTPSTQLKLRPANISIDFETHDISRRTEKERH
jgi:hypothetical protein